MGDLVQGISIASIRIAPFTGKELREVLRRPGALLSLILGPFLVMALFGLGYSGYRAPFATEIVVPESSDFPRSAEDYEDLAPGRLDVREVGDRSRRRPSSGCATGRSTCWSSRPRTPAASCARAGRRRSGSPGTRSTPSTTSWPPWRPRSW